MLQVLAQKDYTTICGSAPGEILALIGLRAKATLVARHLARIDRNLGLLDDFFRRYGEWLTWVKPRAGTIGFPRLLGAPEAEAFCRKLVTETSIMLLPSTVYDYGNRHVRLGFGRENLPEALARLTDYLDSR